MHFIYFGQVCVCGGGGGGEGGEGVEGGRGGMGGMVSQAKMVRFADMFLYSL